MTGTAAAAGDQPEVLVERKDAVLVITINRPSARNAVTAAVSTAIAAALDTLDGDASLTVGVLTGAGGNFCAGMDLKAFLRGEKPSTPGRGFGGLVEAPPQKPLIAAVEGYALAGGFELALACDLIVAGKGASFGLPEVKRGLVPAAGGLVSLPRKVPPSIAMEWVLTGDKVSAARAYEAGLVNRLVADGDALAGALEIAATIAANGPLAVRVSKQVLSLQSEFEADKRFELQREYTAPVFESADAQEGARAFAEKRVPKWVGR
jgi:enoyl-CoA hydratase